MRAEHDTTQHSSASHHSPANGPGCSSVLLGDLSNGTTELHRSLLWKKYPKNEPVLNGTAEIWLPGALESEMHVTASCFPLPR